MRLRRVESGHRWQHKLTLRMIGMLSVDPAQPYDVVKVLLYRPEFFGQSFAPLTQAVMRGPSAWSVGERELFAAFVSRQNECRF